MSKRDSYNEVQQFRQPWVWALLLFCLIVVGYSQQTGGIIILGGVLLLFWFLKLETVIDENGISYRWLPFQIQYRVIKWDEIEEISVRRYAPVAEFGGWGLRLGWKGNAMTVSGNFGIEIRRKNKRRFLLIGTQQPDRVRPVIEQNQINQ